LVLAKALGTVAGAGVGAVGWWLPFWTSPFPPVTGAIAGALIGGLFVGRRTRRSMLVGSAAGAAAGLLAMAASGELYEGVYGPLLALAGIAVGTALGLAIGLLRELWNPSRSAAAVGRGKAASGASALALIPPFFLLQAVIALAGVWAYYGLLIALNGFSPAFPVLR
jgi:Na+/proline symporter